tara:strand:- start:1330 stop:2259 length:930 start_codon:yes stop_codon:yes gene_type:complete
MSRITRGRAGVGDLASAADLNGTYSDFTQTGALNTYNTRDQAFDLPHFTNTPILLNHATAALGNSGMTHLAPVSEALSTTNASSPVKTPLATSTGTATFLNLSSAPWTTASGDVIRLWWNLSVASSWADATKRPWDDPDALGMYTLPGVAGSLGMSDGLHLWVIYLQWDITSAGLLNWVEVPGQSSFTSTVGSYKGAYVYDLAASSVVSPWTLFSAGDADAGSVPTSETQRSQGYFANYGMWAYPATGAVTVYGFRLVITGILHPVHLSLGNEDNAIVYDTIVSTGAHAYDPKLYYKSGRINALQMRGS